MAELADATDLGSVGQPCKFKSCYPYQTDSPSNFAFEKAFGLSGNRKRLSAAGEFMNTRTKEYVVAQTKDLISASCVCKEAKEAAEKWLAALATPDEKAETKKYLQELSEDVEPIDELLAFAGSSLCKSLFGEEAAKGFLKHAEELKAKGAAYCDCPACTACVNILACKNEMLG